MSNEQISQRNQRIIAHIKESWSDLPQPTPERIATILGFLHSLPEQAAKVGLETIAAYLTNTMSVHLFDLLATFQERAEQEGFSAADREEILKDVLPDILKLVKELKEHVTVSSLDDLAILGNTTIGLQVLSMIDSADDAQSWLYQLPYICQYQLAERNLLDDKQVPDIVIQKAVHKSSDTTALQLASIPENTYVPIQLSSNSLKISPSTLAA